MSCENAIDITVKELYLHGLLVNNICFLKNARTVTKHTNDRSVWVSSGKCYVFCQVPNIFFFGYYTTIICSSLFSTTSYNFIKIQRMLKQPSVFIKQIFFCINLFKFPLFFHHFNLLAKYGHFPFDISIFIYLFLTQHATE